MKVKRDRNITSLQASTTIWICIFKYLRTHTKKKPWAIACAKKEVKINYNAYLLRHKSTFDYYSFLPLEYLFSSFYRSHSSTHIFAITLDTNQLLLLKLRFFSLSPSPFSFLRWSIGALWRCFCQKVLVRPWLGQYVVTYRLSNHGCYRYDRDFTEVINIGNLVA